MQFDPLYHHVLDYLKNKLPEYLRYHSPGHTEGVVKAAELIGRAEGLNEYALIVVKTAALLHDSGFAVNKDHHEKLSCDFAAETLPKFGYSNGQIEEICELIMATKTPQDPHNQLSEILCDADLFYLGTDDYAHRADDLHKELKHFKKAPSQEDWLLQQINFLKSHKYFTKSAQDWNEHKKQQTIKALQKQFQDTVSKKGKSYESRMFLIDMLYLVTGVAFAGFALKCFMVPNHFFDGGATGISLLVHENYHFNLGLVLLLINLPMIVAGYFLVGKRFALRTFVGIVALGVALLLIPDVPLTSDKLLISLFGGVFLGIGTGLVMRAGAALDGIEVLAVLALRKTSFTISEIIMAINVLIFLVAAFQFGINTALYSTLTYFAASKSIDYVVEGLEAYMGVTIVSSKSELVKYRLVNELYKGITVYKGERGFLPGNFEVSTDVDIIFTIITRLELRRLKNLVYETDPKAFVYVNKIRETSGGILKNLHSH